LNSNLLRLRPASLIFAALLSAAAAQAAPISTPLANTTGDSAAVAALMDKAQWQQALERADEALKARPKDAQLRFQRAVALGELGRFADTVAAYESLIQDYPELPEPYNNLGVLHASKGNYSAAYDQFQRALLAMPGYATAHENLGDLLISMAVDNYQKAEKFDPKSRTVPVKLSAARELATRLRAVR
jgi:Flp pilus assembly protein TadD